MITLFNDYFRKYIAFSAFHQIFRRQNTKKHIFAPDNQQKYCFLPIYASFYAFAHYYLMEENANNLTIQIFEHELHEFLFLNTD